MHSTALPYAAERQRVRAKLRTEGQSGTVPMVVQAIYPSPVWRATRRLRVVPQNPRFATSSCCATYAALSRLTPIRYRCDVVDSVHHNPVITAADLHRCW